MTTVTYQSLQTEGLIKFSFDAMTTNFRTIDSFIKNFTTFQRKFIDMQKIQKATALDISNFKVSTTNTFSTMNEVLESRGSISKGNNKLVEEEMVQVKQSMKDLKLFVTESTRDLNATLELKEKETQQVYKKYDLKLHELSTYRESDKLRIQSLQTQIYNIKARYSTKVQIAENLRQALREASREVAEVKKQIQDLNDLLSNLGVREFKDHLDKMQKQLYSDMADLKIKFKLKTDISDTLRLQQMLLNMLTNTYDNITKKFSNKNETKKALIYLEKKINSIIQSNFVQQDTDREGLLATKGWKCVSCSKDLGQMEGKLDKYKPWSVFPVRENTNKQKYSGFGNGFQSIIETAVSKKGGQVGFDEKGRMTTPFNLSRQVQGAPPLLKNNQSLSKLKSSSPAKQPTQSNFMNLFGRNSQIDFNIRNQYLQMQKGLSRIIKDQTGNK